MFRKTCFSLLALFLLINLLSACCPCPGKDEYNRKVEWVSMSLRTGTYTSDTSGIRLQQSATSEFADSLLAIQVQLDGRLLAARSVERHDWFGTAAYACKCADVTYRAVTPVTSLVVTTLNDFDAAHPAGSMITDHFRSIDYVNGRNALVPFSMPDFSEVYVSSPQIPLLLDARPVAHGPQRFAVALTLGNGSVFRDTTAVLQF